MQVYSGKGNLGFGGLQGQTTKKINSCKRTAAVDEKGLSIQQTRGAKADADRYVRQTGTAEGMEVVSDSKLTAKQAGELARKYDVNNMTTDDYNSLLKELKDSGLISLKGYRICAGGEVPYTIPDGVICKETDENDLLVWPSGNDKADYIKLLKSNMMLCGNFLMEGAADNATKQYAQSARGEYSHVISLFQQISEAREIQNKS